MATIMRPQKRKTKKKFIKLQLSIGRFKSKLFQKHKSLENKRTKKKPKAKPKSKKIAKTAFNATTENTPQIQDQN